MSRFLKWIGRYVRLRPIRPKWQRHNVRLRSNRPKRQCHKVRLEAIRPKRKGPMCFLDLILKITGLPHVNNLEFSFLQAK